MTNARMTLRKAMKMLDTNEAWTIGTENGQGWIFYFDGKELHDGSRYGLTLDDLLDRVCVQAYDREERKHMNERDRKYNPYMELEAGLAFIVMGYESGTI